MNHVYYYLAVAFFALAAACFIFYLVKNKKLTVENMKKWLLYAVVLAEKKFGGGTGILKLRYVYDMFVEKFPSLVMLIPFDEFANYVDDALVTMRTLLESNKTIAGYIENND